MVENFKDITERKKAEQALLKSEVRYKSVIQDLPILICRFNTDGIIEFVNDAYCGYFGIKREKLIGKDFYGLIPKANRQEVQANLSKLSAKNPLQSHEHKVVDALGHIRYQRWRNSSANEYNE